MTRAPGEQSRKTASATADNIERSREGFRLFEAGEIDALIELYSRDAVVHHPEGWPESGPSVGRSSIRRQFVALHEGWDEHRVEILEIDGRGDWVVARVKWEVRGGKSGADVTLVYSAATRFEGGEIAEVRYCLDHEDALRAAGWAGAQPPANPSSG